MTADQVHAAAVVGECANSGQRGRFLWPVPSCSFLFQQPHAESAALCCQALLHSTKLQAGLWRARSCVVAGRVVARGGWVGQKLRLYPYSIAWRHGSCRSSSAPGSASGSDCDGRPSLPGAAFAPVKRSGVVTPKEGHACILAEIEQLIVKKPI